MIGKLGQGTTTNNSTISHFDSGPGLFAVRRREKSEEVEYFYRSQVYNDLKIE